MSEPHERPADESAEQAPANPTAPADESPTFHPLVSPPGDTLEQALGRYRIQLPAEQIALLDGYCRALWEWNDKINLTRHTDYEKFVARDVVDSLAIAELLETGEKILDVGTGGGVPGIILAIVRPDVSVSLCDSVAKKARVTGEIVRGLGLNVPVLHGPAQELVERSSYNTLVFRAVARMDKILTWLKPHWDAFDRVLLIKGPQWIDERGEARHRGLLHDLELRKLASYPLAGTESESVILQIREADVG